MAQWRCGGYRWSEEGWPGKALYFLSPRFYLLIFREGKGGRKRRRESLTHCLLYAPQLGTEPATQTHPLTWNWTDDLSRPGRRLGISSSGPLGEARPPPLPPALGVPGLPAAPHAAVSPSGRTVLHSRGGVCEFQLPPLFTCPSSPSSSVGAVLVSGRGTSWWFVSGCVFMLSEGEHLLFPSKEILFVLSFRDRGREGDRERTIHLLLPLRCALTRD